MNIEKFNQSAFKGKLKALHSDAESFRKDKNDAVDVSLTEVISQSEEFTTGDNPVIEKPESFSLADLLEACGIDPSTDTISNIFTVPDDDIRWVVPEVIREAIRTGLRRSPIWSAITASEVNLGGIQAVMPYINMSDAAPKKVNEAETMSLGTVSYGQKQVKIFKVGRGIALSYEVLNYVTLDVVSIFLEDFGMKLGYALDSLALDVIINGEQADGSESAPVIGVATAGTKVYRDFLRAWIRMSRIGRNLNTIIGDEDSALDTLDMSEFKDRTSGTPRASLDLKTPVPASASYYIHGNVPASQEIMIDPTRALVKFNGMPLMIESEKIVSNQTEAFYVSLSTGFAKMFRDAAIILDKSVAFSSNGFPSWLDVDAAENVNFNS